MSENDRPYAERIAVEALRMPRTVAPIDRPHVARVVVDALTPAIAAQWAAWFRESAAQADDLTEGQREGFRIAAEHLESPGVAALAARIEP